MVLTTDPRKSMDDLVFEGRNKVYGAYQLRRMYGRNRAVPVTFTLPIKFELMDKKKYR